MNENESYFPDKRQLNFPFMEEKERKISIDSLEVTDALKELSQQKQVPRPKLEDLHTVPSIIDALNTFKYTYEEQKALVKKSEELLFKEDE